MLRPNLIHRDDTSSATNSLSSSAARRLARSLRARTRRRLNWQFWRDSDFHESEEGMLTLATVITVLGLMVLIALLGNIGETVVEKIELQNDADAAAYSSALWMARGMNAVTTTNHLLGEITALCVLHEAFGGPELDNASGQGWLVSMHHDDVDTMNQEIQFLEDPAPVTKYSPYWPQLQSVHKIDAKLVSFAIDQMAPDNERFKAGAMIYDAKVTLKRQLLAMLRLKSLANAGYFVPPWIGPFPVGIATAIAASVVHLYASAQIVLMVKEWLIVALIQEAAIVISPIKTETIEPILIPALANYADQVTKSNLGGGSPILRDRVKAALDALDGRRGAKLSTFPAPRDLKLPLVEEPKPQSGGNMISLGEDPLDDTELDADYAQHLKNMQGALQEASDRDNRPEKLEDAEDITEQIRDNKEKLEDEVEAQKDDDEKAKEEEEKLKSENKPIPPKSAEQTEKERVRAQKIKELEAEQKRLVALREKIIQDLKVNSKDAIPGEAGAQDQITETGLSVTDPNEGFPTDDVLKAQAQNKDPEQLQGDVDRLEGLDEGMGELLADEDAELSEKEREDLTIAQKQVQRELAERKKELQFARQSGGFGKIKALQSLNGRNPSSVNLMKVSLNQDQEKFTQWMRASYPHIDALRSPLLGMMNSTLEKSRAAASYKVWSDRYSIVKPFQFRAGKKWSVQGLVPHLTPDSNAKQGPQHMYVLNDTYENANSTKPQKGFEPWRKGKDPAEKYFTVIGFAFRPKHHGLFADVIFKSPHTEGNLALSQAIVYNANLETLPSSTEPGKTQPSVGWDTLNWQTPVKAPEHGTISGANGELWPWELFSQGNQTSTSRNKVKLNWQAKLVPVTGSRTGQARNNGNVPQDVKDVLKRTKTNFDSLIQH